MQKKIYPLITTFFTLIMSSCSPNFNNTHILRNGELLVEDEINDDNAYKEGTFSYIDSLMKAKDSFILYLVQDECSACANFKDKMLDYVKESKNLVVRISANVKSNYGYDENEEFSKLIKNYKDIFFINNEFVTPSVYVVNKGESAIKVPNSRYSTSIMFKNAMNDYVYPNSIYAFTDVTKYNAFLNKEDDLLTIAVDYTNSAATYLYQNYIYQYVDSVNKKIALIQINETNKNAFLEALNIEDITYPLGFQKKDNLSYIFQADGANNKEFIDNYLNY